VFNQGKESKGYGGGVCQVSSTLFNTAEKAGLEIVERHRHSKRVYYVPKGKDAATSYGGVDFKFKNTLAYPIKINARADDEKVTVSVIKA
jgi:vancomycin resistance protein YoaR